VGDVLDAQELVRDVYTGKADLGSVFAALKVSQAEADSVAHALQECTGPEVPEGSGS
jgi:hypothetical protein